MVGAEAQWLGVLLQHEVERPIAPAQPLRQHRLRLVELPMTLRHRGIGRDPPSTICCSNCSTVSPWPWLTMETVIPTGLVAPRCPLGRTPQPAPAAQAGAVLVGQQQLGDAVGGQRPSRCRWPGRSRRCCARTAARSNRWSCRESSALAQHHGRGPCTVAPELAVVVGRQLHPHPAAEGRAGNRAGYPHLRRTPRRWSRAPACPAAAGSGSADPQHALAAAAVVCPARNRCRGPVACEARRLWLSMKKPRARARTSGLEHEHAFNGGGLGVHAPPRRSRSMRSR